MLKKCVTIFITILSICIVSGCSTKSNNNEVALKAQSVEKSDGSISNSIIIASVPEAAKVPQQFYEAINNKKYDIAKSLLGPTLAFMGEDSMRKYWVNLESVEITNFKDISDKVVTLNSQQEKYYSIKFYYANLNIKVKDPNLVPNLNIMQTRKFTVVKVNKDSPWLLDGDEDTDVIN